MARVPGKSLSLFTVFMTNLFLTPMHGFAVEEEGSYPFGKEKVTRLHFFFHDTLTGSNPTAVKVAEPSGTPRPFRFGTVIVIDDLLTAGVDPASEVVGNAQGFYALTGLDNFSIVMAVDLGFTAGEYNGSSISVVSRNPVTETNRELAVVGGRGGSGWPAASPVSPHDT